MLRRRFVRDLVGQLGCDRTFICRKNTYSHGALPNYQRKKAKMRFDQDVRLRDLFGISIPIIQAPMAGAAFSDMVVAVSEAGGLGSLACAMLTSLQIRQEVGLIRQQTSRPINLNFFCHRPPVSDARRDASWKRRLEPYYRELAIDPLQAGPSASRGAFDAAAREIVEEIIPEVVSFHFGLPEETLVERVKSIGCRIISSATTVSEARWLEERGCDAIVAQGYEAGGHRGIFLETEIATQIGTMALVPQIVDAVKVPVIAAGGIADARGIAAALILGASGVQLGTAYLFCPEAKISPVHRERLRTARDNETALTNVFTGRPARSIVNRLVSELGPMVADAPEFPLASDAVMPLRQAALARNSADFVPLWSGQAARLGIELSAGELTEHLAASTRELLARS
jgi:nitronate monooxygenase